MPLDTPQPRELQSLQAQALVSQCDTAHTYIMDSDCVLDLDPRRYNAKDIDPEMDIFGLRGPNNAFAIARALARLPFNSFTGDENLALDLDQELREDEHETDEEGFFLVDYLKFFEFSDILDCLDLDLVDLEISKSSTNPNAENKTAEAAPSISACVNTIVSLEAELYFWKADTEEFVLQRVVMAEIGQTKGVFQFFILAKVDDRPLLAHQITASMNQRFSGKMSSITWNNIAETPATSWLFRFTSRPAYREFYEAFRRCLWEELNQSLWEKFKVNEQNYHTCSIQDEDVTMRDVEDEEADQYAEPSSQKRRFDCISGSPVSSSQRKRQRMDSPTFGDAPDSL
ncbi:VID27 cytoplasmic protein-domain-containing protein [Mycena floridula]|nr:VID27 cytoplasmic protein-domain-containing protein [Mycena floridula]